MNQARSAVGRPARAWRLGLIRALPLVATAMLFVAGRPPTSSARAASGACDQWLRQTRQMTGSYVPAEQPYARPFVFAMLLDCNGVKERVTVQRPTGNLPVCQERQDVELVGTLNWSKRFLDAHYEITDPSSVTCRAVVLQGPAEGSKPPPAREVAPPTPTAPPAPTAPPTPTAVPSTPPAPPRVNTSAVASRVWTGRYQDSRGAGDIIFTLLRGPSTVSGAWKLRTGGGGPVTGILEADGRRMQLRMDNLAPECPGTFEGSAEMTDTTLVATYSGRDCQGGVTAGHLELHIQ